jgi:hypothetical protein
MSAAAVIDALAAVTMPVPKRPITFALNMLEITVPPQVITEAYPATGTGTSRCLYIEGRAEPRKESGSPRLINDIYITVKSTSALCLADSYMQFVQLLLFNLAWAVVHGA